MQANLKTLTITNGVCKASFTDISRILSDVRVQGWISAPSREEGFAFSRSLGHALGRESVGGFCFEDKGPVDFPFEFDVQRQLTGFGRYQHCRLEDGDELLARVHRMIKNAKRMFVAEQLTASPENT